MAKSQRKQKLKNVANEETSCNLNDLKDDRNLQYFANIFIDNVEIQCLSYDARAIM